MRRSNNSLVVVVVVVSFCAVVGAGCFPLDRVQQLPPGTIRGTTEPNARVDVVGSTVTRRADNDGVFVVAGLGAGDVRLRITRDVDGDGAPERGAIQDVFLGKAGDVPLGVDVGDVVLFGTGSLRGVVVGGAGARVVVARGGASEVDILSAAEQETGADASGAYRLRGVVAGEVIVVAAKDGEVSVGDRVTVPAGGEGVVDDIALDTAFGVQVSVVFDDETGLDEDDEEGIDVAINGDRLTLTDFVSLPAGVGYTVELDQPGHFGALFSQVVPNGLLGAVTWGPLVVTDVDPCPANGLRDCDDDGSRGLPFLVDNEDPNLAIWRACDAACAVFGDSDAACDVDGEGTFDCDDDNDGQPDVTEPYACIGPGKGTDLDGDFLCSVVDPFPDCAANDAAVCVPVEDDDVFVPPPPVTEPFSPPPSVCGDGVKNDDEACDDGNVVNGDGCEGDCTFVCGPANSEGDAGVLRAFDDHAGHCVVDVGVHRAADGAALCATAGGALETDAARLQTFASGLVVVDEDCALFSADDVDHGRDCDVDAGVFCGLATDVVAGVCGDGVVGDDEDCDDGNDVDGDGCTDCRLSCGRIAGMASAKEIADGRCLYRSRAVATWTVADDVCRAAGGSLYTDDALDPLPGNYWMGLTDARREGTFRWQSGSPAAEIDEQFLVPPDDGGAGQGGPDGEDCVGRTADGRWYDDDCATLRLFACEKGARPRVGDGRVDVGEECDDGNDDNGDGCDGDALPCSIAGIDASRAILLPDGRCWVFAAGTRDHVDAAAACAAQDAQLATINDARENTLFGRLVGDSEAWIGLEQDGDFVSWRSGAAFEFQNFERNAEPDNVGADVWFARSHAHGWARADGLTQAAVVCEAALSVPAVVCGDGIVGAGEDCDDGNDVDFDGCNADCALGCGDGDVGVFDAHGNCVGVSFDGDCGRNNPWGPADLDDIKRVADRLPPFTRVFGEDDKVDDEFSAFTVFAADEPDDVDGASDEAHCLTLDPAGHRDVDCQLRDPVACLVPPPVCGDGITNGNEDCDDQNLINGDGCDNGCVFPCNAPARADAAIRVADACFWSAGGVDTFDNSSAVCIAAGGRLVEPNTIEKTRAVVRLAANLDTNLFLGIGDAVEDGTFVGTTTGDTMATSFVGNEPQGGGGENCVVAASGGWFDVDCAGAFGAICETPAVAGATVCGDGVVEGAEECDDGNVIDADGCEADCSFVCGPSSARAAVQLSDRCAWVADNNIAGGGRGGFTSGLSRCTADGQPAVFNTEADARLMFGPTLAPLYAELAVIWAGMTEEGQIFGPQPHPGSPVNFLEQQPFPLGPIDSPSTNSGGTCNVFVVDGLDARGCGFGNNFATWCSSP